MEGLVRRWRGHGWSRLSHGVHTGGGRARITLTLVSVGPHNIAGFPSPALPPPPVGPARYSELLNKLMAEAACFFRDGVRRSALGGLERPR